MEVETFDFTSVTSVLFLERRLGTKLYFQPILIFTEYFLIFEDPNS